MSASRWTPVACPFAVALLAALSGGSRAGAQPSAPPAPVVATPVIELVNGTTQQYVGTIRPKRRAVVGAAVDGRVAEFHVNQGQRVEAGAALAQLLTETISLDLNAAEQDVALRKAELDELLNGERSEVVTQTKARREAAQAALEYATQRLNRMTRLFEQGEAVSRDELEQTRSVQQAAEELLRQREAELLEVQTGARPEKIAQAEARLRSAEAAVAKLQDQINKHTVITRFSGYVVTEYTEEGQWVKRGDPVAEVIALDVVEVEAFVSESHMPFVRAGAEVTVTAPALNDQTFPGTVINVVPQADARTRSFPVIVEIQNTITEAGPLLKAGMLTRVELPTSEPLPAKLIPKDALVLGGATPRVCVVQANDQGGRQAVFIPVKIGEPRESYIEIEGDCRPGDLVVVRGNERLRPGQAVVVSETLPPPEQWRTAAGDPPSVEASASRQ